MAWFFLIGDSFNLKVQSVIVISSFFVFFLIQAQFGKGKRSIFLIIQYIFNKLIFLIKFEFYLSFVTLFSQVK